MRLHFFGRIFQSGLRKLRLTAVFGFIFFLCADSHARNLRIISLMPSYTEIIYALGAQNNLVGVSNFCDYPPAALKKEKVGDYLRPNLEKIYSLKPDIVFSSGWKNSAFLENISNLGIELVKIPEEKSIKDIYRTIRTIADKMDAKKRAEEIIESMKKRLAEVAGKAENSRLHGVYMEIDEKYWTVGGKSFINDVVEKAGGKNIFSNVPRGYFQTSWESVVEKNPDAVVLLKTPEEEFLKRPLSGKLPAVKNGAIITGLDEDRISRPSPGIVEAVILLAGKLNSVNEKEN